MQLFQQQILSPSLLLKLDLFQLVLGLLPPFNYLEFFLYLNLLLNFPELSLTLLFRLQSKHLHLLVGFLSLFFQFSNKLLCFPFQQKFLLIVLQIGFGRILQTNHNIFAQTPAFVLLIYGLGLARNFDTLILRCIFPMIASTPLHSFQRFITFVIFDNPLRTFNDSILSSGIYLNRQPLFAGIDTFAWPGFVIHIAFHPKLLGGQLSGILITVIHDYQISKINLIMDEPINSFQFSISLGILQILLHQLCHMRCHTFTGFETSHILSFLGLNKILFATEQLLQPGYLLEL